MSMSRDEIYSKVQEVLVDALGVDEEDVTPAATRRGFHLDRHAAWSNAGRLSFPKKPLAARSKERSSVCRTLYAETARTKYRID